MSLWFFLKDRRGHRAVYSVGLPPQLILFVAALLAALLYPIVSLLLSE